jgi:mannose-6-phosphate isomerase-like protein (cupin superfamily)
VSGVRVPPPASESPVKQSLPCPGIYVVVAGSGHAKLDDELVDLETWDVLRVAPPVVRSFEAGPDGLELICIGGRKPKGGDTERIANFWG